ncbi:MAG: molybdopterin-dependent oxidoreductase [Bacteroidota bacterium]|nr:molybdopterin-dependent oxidoreductase [Bacteroidota bacterium]
MDKSINKNTGEETVSEKKIKRRNFISFGALIGLNAAAFGVWKWLYNSKPEEPGVTAGARKPLRRALNQTELFFRKTFSSNHLVMTYPTSMAAKKVRVNSNIGIDDDNYKPEDWIMTVNKSDGTALEVTLKDLMALPKTEIVYDFKCVEGWDQIQHWGGVKFGDFIAHYHLEKETGLQYVGLATPNEEYYVGIDMASAMHPQTLLAYEVNEQPLPLEHGRPLRLIIPVKYGIKNLKRIGSISFSNTRPPDYWAEQGYDYYSGL